MDDILSAQNLVNSPDYKWAKDKLNAICDAYIHSNLSGSDTQVGREYKRRVEVAALLRTWFDEIEGTADTPLPPVPEDTHIKRFGGSSD